MKGETSLEQGPGACGFFLEDGDLCPGFFSSLLSV